MRMLDSIDSECLLYITYTVYTLYTHLYQMTLQMSNCPIVGIFICRIQYDDMYWICAYQTHYACTCVKFNKPIAWKSNEWTRNHKYYCKWKKSRTWTYGYKKREIIERVSVWVCECVCLEVHGRMCKQEDSNTSVNVDCALQWQALFYIRFQLLRNGNDSSMQSRAFMYKIKFS